MGKVVALLFILVGTVSGILIATTPLRQTTYSGRVVFDTEQEYSAFKRALSQPYVSFNNDDVLVLSSEPPIVVQFHVNTQPEYPFPYGTYKTFGDVAIVVGGVASVLVAWVLGSIMLIAEVED